MSELPWESWIPGVLSPAQVRELLAKEFIVALETAIDASSFDLTLTSEAYEMPEGGVKPSGGGFLAELQKQNFIRPLVSVQNGSFDLEAKKTYLFKLREKILRRPELVAAGFYGQATARSSIGRLDVLVRFILDGMKSYEGFDPKGLANGNGDMYVEVTPLTFAIRVREGLPLSQLRLFYGNPHDVEIRGDAVCRTVLRSVGQHIDGPFISVNLRPCDIGGLDAVAFTPKASKEPLDLCGTMSKPVSLDPLTYWNIHKAEARERLIIEQDQFYILRSKERMWVPQGVAVYGRATDETIGEMRIHYAGFAHPFFGMRRRDGQVGAPLIFEVRGHDVNVVLKHGETMARVFFYRMSQDADMPTEQPAYTDQDLMLSRYFAPWPKKLRYESDGSVAIDLG